MTVTGLEYALDGQSVSWGLGLVYTFRFSTFLKVPIIAGQSSATQESIGVFTQPVRLAGREFISRLPGSTRSYSLLCPVAVR